MYPHPSQNAYRPTPYHVTTPPVRHPWREAATNALLSRIPNVRPLNYERSQFEVALTGQLHSLRLCVTLPPAFPSEAPQLMLSHQLQHPWVDSSRRIINDRLRRWTSVESTWTPLEVLVKEVIDALAAPPAVPPAAQPAPRVPPVQHSAPDNLQEKVVTPAFERCTSGYRCTSSSQFTELDEMSEEKLRELLVSEEAFDELLGQVTQRIVGRDNESLKRLRDQNLEIAKRTVELMEQCKELENQMNIIRACDYVPTKADFDDRAARQSAVLAHISEATLMGHLAAAAESADTHSELLLERFLAGQSSVESFLDEYPKARALYHTREAKRADMEPKLKALGHVA